MVSRLATAVALSASLTAPVAAQNLTDRMDAVCASVVPITVRYDAPTQEMRAAASAYLFLSSEAFDYLISGTPALPSQTGLRASAGSQEMTLVQRIGSEIALWRAPRGVGKPFDTIKLDALFARMILPAKDFDDCQAVYALGMPHDTAGRDRLLQCVSRLGYQGPPMLFTCARRGDHTEWALVHIDDVAYRKEANTYRPKAYLGYTLLETDATPWPELTGAPLFDLSDDDAMLAVGYIGSVAPTSGGLKIAAHPAEILSELLEGYVYEDLRLLSQFP